MHDRLPLPQSDLDREENHLDLEEKATRRERKFWYNPRSVLGWTRSTGSSTGRPIPQPVEPVGHSLDRLNLFGTENLFF